MTPESLRKVPTEITYDGKVGRWRWLEVTSVNPARLVELCHDAGVDLSDQVLKDFSLPHPKPRLDLRGDQLTMVLKTARYIDSEEVIELGELDLAVTGQAVTVVNHGQEFDLADVRRATAEARTPIEVVLAVLECVIARYDPVVDGVTTDIDQVEDLVFSTLRTQPTERIYYLKREVVAFHRAMSPLLGHLLLVSEGGPDEIDEVLKPRIRHLADSLTRIIEITHGQRDLLTSVLEANLAQISVRQNEDMRKISAAVAIVAVPTLIAGIYGMNFEHMPELHSTWGYPASLALMGVVCLSMHRWFRHIGWL